jgi:hypothetical protein
MSHNGWNVTVVVMMLTVFMLIVRISAGCRHRLLLPVVEVEIGRSDSKTWYVQ